MGLFGKLFEKKECDICGAEIKLFGNRKLEDGNLCKACNEKLSPWFDERRTSTVDKIKRQLEYREENRAKVQVFRVTRTLGESMKVLLDEDAGLFMVTNQRDLEKANPDVLSFSDVTGCVIDIDENKTEVMREDKDGKEISYIPKRYEYEYNFYIAIQVRHPYFDEMRFCVNDSSVDAGCFSGVVNPERNMDYRQYKKMCEEIKNAILNVREQAREEEKAAAAPKPVKVCPYCGATTQADDKGCCEYCGGPLEN